LALKADIVADQLYRLGGFADPPIALTRPSPRLWGSQYEAVLYQGAGGKLGFKTNQHTGFPAPAEAVIPLEECHTLTPSLFAFLDLLDLDLPTLTRIILRENEVGEIMVTLSTSDDEPPEIALDLPASVNFLLSDNEPANLLGKTHLRYQLGGLSGRVTAGVSWRANLYQSAALWGFLRSTLPLNGDEHLLDLYAGAGWLSVLFAPHVDHITMVESYPPALTDADENLAAYDHITLIEGDALAVVEDMLGETRCEVALLDPLPAGLGAQMCVALSALAPKRLVYVSENPVSLAQDARVLAKEGKYHLRLVQPFDFEPHTFHAVSVAFFER
jgi:tRNA/tmRNA/rRNA uracil-C5-methylase (TrmA/RlmC/RlmD family)